jgi:hypothetical protein
MALTSLFPVTSKLVEGARHERRKRAGALKEIVVSSSEMNPGANDTFFSKVQRGRCTRFQMIQPSAEYASAYSGNEV